jgi:multisubunit Na+/H+ antiporter MnhF subunit
MIVILLYFLACVILGVSVLFIREKNNFIKFLYVNYLTNIVILFMVALGSFAYNSYYIDIAFIYSILSFIASKALLKYSSTN